MSDESPYLVQLRAAKTALRDALRRYVEQENIDWHELQILGCMVTDVESRITKAETNAQFVCQDRNVGLPADRPRPEGWAEMAMAPRPALLAGGPLVNAIPTHNDYLRELVLGIAPVTQALAENLRAQTARHAAAELESLANAREALPDFAITQRDEIGKRIAKLSSKIASIAQVEKPIVEASAPTSEGAAS